MNERIKQLALECYNPYGNFDHEKFARLIIDAVIDIANDQKNYNSVIYTTHDRDQARGIVKELVKSINQQLG
jgi:UDP-N-acetylglucosamine 2-epimerase